MNFEDPVTWAAISTLAAIITAVIAAWSLIGSRKDSRQRTRPLVVASLQPGPRHVHGVVYLAIANSGHTAARNLQVTFDPPLEPSEAESKSDRDHIVDALNARYANPFEVLAPGQRLFNSVIHFVEGKDRYGGVLRDKTTVHVTYEDSVRNWRWRTRIYRDSFQLRANAHNWEMRAAPGDNNDFEKTVKSALDGLVWEAWVSNV